MLTSCLRSGASSFKRSLSCAAPSPSGGRALSAGVDDFGDETAASAHPARDALANGRLAVSFSGGGFLLPYFIGVAEVLQQLGVLRPGGGTLLAGSSAGSLIATSIACGLTTTEMYDSFLDSVKDCRANGSYRRLNAVVLRQLEATLPADAAERCSGVATIGVTRVFPHPHTKRISAFHSRADLIAALMASCHIPRYFNGSMFTSFRGKRTMDGGVTALMPEPLGPHDFLLKVSCFPRDHIARLPVFNRGRALQQLSLGIAPDRFGPWPFSLRDMLAAALHPHSDDFIARLREAGRSDAAKWALMAGIAPGPAPSPSPLSPLVLALSEASSADGGGAGASPQAAAAAAAAAPLEAVGPHAPTLPVSAHGGSTAGSKAVSASDSASVQPAAGSVLLAAERAPAPAEEGLSRSMPVGCDRSPGPAAAGADGSEVERVGAGSGGLVSLAGPPSAGNVGGGRCAPLLEAAAA